MTCSVARPQVTVVERATFYKSLFLFQQILETDIKVQQNTSFAFLIENQKKNLKCAIKQSPKYLFWTDLLRFMYDQNSNFKSLHLYSTKHVNNFEFIWAFLMSWLRHHLTFQQKRNFYRPIKHIVKNCIFTTNASRSGFKLSHVINQREKTLFFQFTVQDLSLIIHHIYIHCT